VQPAQGVEFWASRTASSSGPRSPVMPVLRGLRRPARGQDGLVLRTCQMLHVKLVTEAVSIPTGQGNCNGDANRTGHDAQEKQTGVTHGDAQNGAWDQAKERSDEVTGGWQLHWGCRAFTIRTIGIGTHEAAIMPVDAF
jgi:hypothetical protein